MYKRQQEETVKRLALKFQVVGIMGPRQSGKTTLARLCFPQLPYVSFENYDVQMRAIQDPRAFLAQYQSGAIFDEVQHAPGILSYLQQVVDEDDRPGRFVVTGSQNFVLSDQISQSLAGRMGLVTLLPLSLMELGGLMSWQEAILKGGYPRLHKYTIAPADYYAAYIHTYIEQDVRQLQNIGDLSAFRHFMQLCAGRSWQILNLTSLAVDASISHTTARRWLSLLEASYVLFLVQPYHHNFNKRLVKQPKLYFYDTGLACALLGIDTTEQLTTHYHHGAFFENFIFTEVLKHRFNQGKQAALYFWRDRVTGVEVDLIAEWGSVLYAIEIKSGQTFNADWLKGVLVLQALQHHAKNFLVYNGPMEGTCKGCELIPFAKLDRLFALM